VQTQGDGVVNQEIAGADGQEEVRASVDGIEPTGEVHSIRVAGDAVRVGQQHIKAIKGFAAGGLNELSEDRLNQDLLLGCAEGNHHVVVNVQTQGMETEEERHPAQMADDGFLVLKHPGKNIVLVGLGVVVTDEEDRSVGEGTAHQEDGDVLVMGVQRSLGRVVLRNEGIRRHGVHVLCHQAGHNTKARQCKSELEMQGVVDGVVKALVTGSKITRSSLGRVVGIQDLADRVADAEVGPVHVAGDHKDATDGQMVMSDVGEPEGFRLGMETTKEGEDRGA